MIKLDGAHDASDSLLKLLVEQGKADDQVRALRRLSTLGLGAAFGLRAPCGLATKVSRIGSRLECHAIRMFVLRGWVP